MRPVFFYNNAIMHNIKATIEIKNNELKNKFHNLGIYSYWDLLLHLPLRYEDMATVYPIANAKIGMHAKVMGVVLSAEILNKKRKMLQVKLESNGQILILTFFHFYPNYTKIFEIGKTIYAYGEIRADPWGNKTIIHPKIQSTNNDALSSKVLTPIYPTTNGLANDKIIKLIEYGLANVEIPEILPKEILDKYKLIDFKQSLFLLHKLTPFDARKNLQQIALTRLKLDELLANQLLMHDAYTKSHINPAVILKPNNTYTQQLIANLPFELTSSQIKVIQEIYADIAKPTQMNRLLQGDVGSGKTVVATLALLVAIENGYQAAIMAPTEILAKQHYLKLSKLLQGTDLELVWLSSSITMKERKAALAKIQSGEAKLVIATHAVIQSDVEFANLALVVIDEQHRFGVDQRLELQSKGNNPHQLMLSATPIPRTLAMAYYADLDLSIIDELPSGRIPIKTILVNNNRKAEVIDFVKNKLLEGSQVYWVCPLIEESEKLDLETAINTYEELSRIFTEFKIGLVHGKLAAKEKDRIMQEFSNQKLDLLVATSVIEVGVDVPNASIMVIEHSERMGLSALHQLRGRVGRGSIESECVLLYQTPLSELASRRLKVMAQTTDGFKIAREDLLIRGPGELLGARQSGLPLFRFANLEEDYEILLKAKELAKVIAKKYPSQAHALTNLWFDANTHYLKA